MKRLLNKAIALALMATTWVGCSQEDYYLNSGQESESDIQISLNLNVPDPIQVTSRAVTEGINNFTVLCFDKEDKALVKETVSATGTESGTLIVTIPNATRVMHVFANQNSSSIPFEKGVTKEADLQNLAATADQMIYWGRIAVPADITSSSAIKTWWTTPKSISLLRSHAKVEVVNNNSDEFVLQGYTVVYTNAAGLAIPYDTENGVYPTVEEWLDGDFIHAATGDATVSGTNETMKPSGPIYVYETSASAETPASIIIKGYNKSDLSQTTKYWRVAFADEEGNQVNIRRNHRYTVSIEGSILFGDTDFAAAVASSSTANSAWLGIADEVTAIKNRDFSLTVENTNYVVSNKTEPEPLKFNFTIEQLGEEAFKMADLSVTWAEGQDVSTSDVVNYTSTTSGTLFSATVNVPLKSFTDMINHEGTIIIKYGKKLQRKVKIIIIPQQAFTITSYNGVTSYTTDENGARVYEVSVNKADYEKDAYTIDGAPIDMLKFSLPITFPEELLPLNVLVSTTDFNVVNSPLIFEGDGGYLDENIGPGYKYVYPVNVAVEEKTIEGSEEIEKVAIAHEIQLRYINNLLVDKVELTLEAENFVPVKLIINYTLAKN